MCWWILAGFAAGVVTGRTPRNDGIGRRMLKGIIRTGYAVGHSVQTAVSEARAEVSTLAAEARTEAAIRPATD